MTEFKKRSKVQVPANALFAWHGRAGAFERLSPPWENVKIVERQGSIRNGDRLIMALKMGPVKRRWVAVHQDYVEGKQFCDVQTKGPFKKWRHTHRFEDEGDESSILEDWVDFTLPFGWFGKLLGLQFTVNKLNRMFEYRHRVTIDDLASHHSNKKGRVMKIIVTGPTGLVGSSLVPFLTTGGHQVLRLVRAKSAAHNSNILWDPYAETIDKEAVEGADAVVHLSGENIAGRWNDDKKRRIRESRVKSTQLLSQTLAGLRKPPKVLVCASAIGYYGDQGDRILKEDNRAGTGFLADVTQEWEAAAAPAVQKGIRVVNLRIGVVLSPTGGALQKMLLPFKMGAGGVTGHGKQYWSWISLDDVIAAIYHCIVTDSLQGPVNAAAPDPVTNKEFTTVLGRVLSRPTLLPMPAFAARMALGEMAESLLLASTRVVPAKLEQSGYKFRHPELEEALRHLLGKTT